MFSITVVFGSTAASLLFKTRETFDSAALSLRTPTAMAFSPENIAVSDDFGQTIEVKRTSVHGLMFEEMDLSSMAQIERGLHNTRTQIAAEKAGQADPVIVGHMRSRGAGPAVLSPLNGFRQ